MDGQLRENVMINIYYHIRVNSKSWLERDSNSRVKMAMDGEGPLYWITLSANWAVLPRGIARDTPHGSSVTTGGNLSTRRKPTMFGRVKLDNNLLTCNQGNFNQITARSRNRTLVTVVRDTCTSTVPPASRAGVGKLVRTALGKLNSQSV